MYLTKMFHGFEEKKLNIQKRTQFTKLQIHKFFFFPFFFVFTFPLLSKDKEQNCLYTLNYAR